MIQTSSAFATANAALAKQPIFVLQIEGYNRLFSNSADQLAAPGNPTLVQANFRENAGGLASKPTDVAIGPTVAGNIVFAFFNNWFTTGSGSAPTLTDTAGWTWNLILSNNTSGLGFGLWWAVADGQANDITFHTTDASAQWIDMWVGEFSDLNTSINSVTGNGAGTYTLDGVPVVYGGSGTIVVVDNTVPSGQQQWTLAFIQNGYLSSPLGSEFFRNSGAVDLTGILTDDWLVNIQDLKITVSDLDGGADLGDLIFNVQDRDQQLTADMENFIFEGKACTLFVGFAGMNFPDFATFFIGSINTVDSDNENLEYQFTVSDINLAKLSQKIYTQSDPDTNGNTVAVDSSHPRTVQGHPLDILVSALEQAGVEASDIDTAKIDFYRDTIFSGLEYVFKLTAAPTAKDFIENQLMKPLGMYLWENNVGLISVNSFYPALTGNGTYTPPTPPVMTLDVDNTITVPLATEADLLNQMTFDFDDDGTGSGNYLAEEIVDFDESISKYNLVNGETIQSQGMRSDFQGYFMAALIGRLIGLRYGFKPLVLDPLTLFWSCCILEPGDIVAVTNAFVPDRNAGVMGVTGKTFEVLDRNWKFMEGQVELRLLELDLTKFKQFLIAPNAESDYTSASPTDQGKYMFLCGSNDEYSSGAPANTLG